MSENTQLDNPEVKSDSFDNQEVKTDSVESNETADNYTVPGHVLAKQKEKYKTLESELSELKDVIKQRDVAEAEKKQEFEALYKEAATERDIYKADADKYQSIEEARKERLLESFPESLRNKISKLDSETLEEMKTELTNKVPQVDNSGGGISGGKPLEWSKLQPKDRKKHFADIMRKNN